MIEKHNSEYNNNKYKFLSFRYFWK
jgi:hypothetical protein